MLGGFNKEDFQISTFSIMKSDEESFVNYEPKCEVAHRTMYNIKFHIRLNSLSREAASAHTSTTLVVENNTQCWETKRHVPVMAASDDNSTA